jgi:four helix bundle protein
VNPVEHLQEIPDSEFPIPQSGIRHQGSGIRNPHSASGIRNAESAIGNQESGISNAESGIGNPESGIRHSPKGGSVKYERFEQLPVWQSAIDLADQTYRLTASSEFARRYSLRDQIERAAVSVSNNIAEGFDRGTNPDLLNFLYIARGSTAEVRSMLCLLEKISAFRNLESGIRNLREQTESISRQLGAWIQSLLNSGMKGQRYVTDKTRALDQQKRDRDAFLKQLEAVRQGAPYVPTKAQA